MNMLVTGGSGFIGSHVVDKLVDAGHQVRVFDLKRPCRDDVEFFQGDITCRDDVTKGLSGRDVIYHIAALSNVDLIKDHPLAAVEQNILGTAYLLEQCRQQGVKRFIFASSVFIFEEKGHLYTTGKLASELLCKNYHTLFSLPYTILRYGTAYGPRSRAANVISRFIQKALKGGNIVIHGSGKQERRFTYVEDLALGSVAALQPIAENKTYTIAGRPPVSIEGLAEIVKGLLNNEIIIEYDSAREDDYGGAVLDINLAKKELGWEPRIGIEEGIKRYIEWYQEDAGLSPASHRSKID